MGITKSVLLALLLLSSPVRALDVSLADLTCGTILESLVFWGQCGSVDTAPSWSSTPALNGIVGVSGSYDVSGLISGSPEPTCILNGVEPSGVTMDGTTCTFSWTNAVAEGTYTGYSITATNTEGSATSATFSMVFATQSGDVLFTQNFDNEADWSPSGGFKCRWAGDTGEGCRDSAAKTPPFAGFEYAYVVDSNPTTSSCNIDSTDDFNGNGKSFYFVDESNGSDGQWKTDCTLMKYLGADYPTLWASYRIKFNPNISHASYHNKQKIFRMGHVKDDIEDGTRVPPQSVFQFESSGWVGLAFLDTSIRSSGSDVQLSTSHRCNSDYRNCAESVGRRADFYRVKDSNNNTILPYTWTNIFADGEWHKIEMKMKINSAKGVNDGEIEIWMDGVLQKKRTNVGWMDSTANLVVTGFNTVMIGGNANNNWDGSGTSGTPTDPEQKLYHIDNVCIGTTQASVNGVGC